MVTILITYCNIKKPNVLLVQPACVSYHSEYPENPGLFYQVSLKNGWYLHNKLSQHVLYITLLMKENLWEGMMYTHTRIFVFDGNIE
jgi:hypothetical protein